VRHRRSAVVVLLAGALLLTACGGSSPLEGKTGPDVAALAADALEEAGSVRVSGSMTQDGNEIELDLRVQDDDVAGSVAAGGVETELVTVDGDLYVRATPAFLAPFGLAADVAEQYEGRWVALPRDETGDFSDFSLAGLAEDFRGDDVAEATREEELDGEDVVVVEQDDMELVVADDDPPYPLQLRSGGDSDGTVVFSEHGEDQDISVPDDVVALEELVELAGS
jgi:hypothetical protein